METVRQREMMIHFYEHQIGRAKRSFEFDLREGVQLDVLEYPRLPWGGAVSLITAGLSEIVKPPFGAELLFACDKKYLNADAVKLLAAASSMVADYVTPERGGLHGGEVLGPAGPLLPGSPLHAFVTCEPAFHPPELRTCETAAGAVRIWWLLPIYEAESRFIEQHGFVEFLKVMEEADPKVLDLKRRPVRLPRTGQRR